MKSLINKPLTILISVLLICQSGVFAWAEDDINTENPQPVETVQEQGNGELPGADLQNIEDTQVEEDQEDVAEPESDGDSLQINTDEEGSVENGINTSIDGTVESEVVESDNQKPNETVKAKNIKKESIIASGICSDNKTRWTLSSEGVMIFSGYGDVTFSSFEEESFVAYKSQTKEVIFEDGITSIGHGMEFSGFNLDRLVIPDSVVDADGFSFISVKELVVTTNIENGGTLLYNSPQKIIFTGSGTASAASITDLSPNLPDKEIKEVVICEGVSGIDESAFYTCEALESIIIPDSCVSIGEEAFRNCSSLGNVTLPNSIEIIGDYAFENCTSLTSIKVPDNCTKVSNGTFYACKNLKKVTLSSMTTSIGACAFSGCDALRTISIPDSVESLGRSAFSGCDNLTSIKVPPLVNEIPYSLCAFCTSLQSVTIPNSVTKIGSRAFSNCTKIYSISMPSSLQSVGDEAFSECTRLRSIDLKKANEIGRSAFYDCSSLKTVKMSCSNVSLGGCAFLGCENLTSVAGGGFSDIDDYAFEYCESLTSIDLGSKLKSIGEKAFYSCGKGFTATIPSCTDSIGYRAFSGDSTIYIRCEPPATVTNAFSEVTGKLYYYCGSMWDDIERPLWNTKGTWKSMHHYGSWKVKKAATEVSSGSKYRNCIGCGYKQTKTISELAPTLPAISILAPIPLKKAATIKWKKVSSKNKNKIAKIQIQYSTDKSFKKGRKSVYVKKTTSKKKLSKLKSNKTYYVRIRAYKKDKNGVHVSRWSKVKSVKAK